jgi:hypothetical protein
LADCSVDNLETPKGKTKKGIMKTYKAPVRTRGIGIAALIFGLLGGAFYWWTPLGMILSLTGLLMGFVGGTTAPRKSTGLGLSIAGMLVSLAALTLNCVIAGLGLELIEFDALR